MPSNTPVDKFLIVAECLMISFAEGEMQVFLVKTPEAALANCWSLPSLPVNVNIALDDAVRLLLVKHLGAKKIFNEQFYTFGSVDRFPAERKISVVYFALVPPDQHDLTRRDADSGWFSVNTLPPLAFDSGSIISKGIAHMQARISQSEIVFELLPEKFTLTQLQLALEALLNRKLDKRNFRKKVLKYDLLKELDEFQTGVSFRAARLYRLDKRKLAKKNL